MNKIKIFLIIILGIVLQPSVSFALAMPQSGNDLADMAGITAQAYVVQDVASGQVLMEKNAQLAWTPASLTKLLTALVVLDTKPKLSKTIAITTEDETLGACTSGGACIKAKPGVKFTVDGLFHAALLPSANNAASALARSTGLTMAQFTERMNKKAQDLGATGFVFNEPTGMDASNSINAAGYAKIVTAAFSNSYLRNIAALNSYVLHSTNNSKYTQTIKNTDKLLNSSDIKILGAKTGYLGSVSGYNFASLLKTDTGEELAVVVLGEQHLYSAFSETSELASLAGEVQGLALMSGTPSVLGASTVAGVQ